MTDLGTARSALMLDDLLTGLTADELADVMERAPVAYRDQAAAATAEMFAGIDNATAAGVVEDASGRLTSEHPAWLRLSLLTTLTGWWAGEADTCVHAPRPSRPAPILAAQWKPALVTCVHCVHLLRVPRGSDADHTCGGCGHVGDDVSKYAVVAGMLAYHSAICSGCRYWKAAA